MAVVSVIVPVYKVEAYLDRCVESILGQTFSDFELILVDDGSPDNCGAMCDAWAEKDSRVRVIHKENGGLSHARNAGFAASNGQWISFVDSDDYIHPEMLRVLYEAAVRHEVAVSCCGFRETDGEPLADVGEPAVELRSPEDYYTRQCTNATVAWGKLYHRSVVLLYPVGKIHEDEYVTYRILFGCGTVAVTDAQLYAYFRNPQGITKVVWNEKRMDIFPAFEERVDFFRDAGFAQLASDHALRYVWNVQRQLAQIRQLPKDRQRPHLKNCRSYLRRAIKKAKTVADIAFSGQCRLYAEVWPVLTPVLWMAGWCHRVASGLWRRIRRR